STNRILRACPDIRNSQCRFYTSSWEPKERLRTARRLNCPAPLVFSNVGPLFKSPLLSSKTLARGLLAQGKPLPTPRPGLALIDTGASGTCIDEQAAQELGLPVIDVVKMTSATHADQESKVYPIQITIPPSLVFNVPRPIGAALAPQGLLILIGRDLLSACNPFYNGPLGQITLSM